MTVSVNSVGKAITAALVLWDPDDEDVDGTVEGIAAAYFMWAEHDANAANEHLAWVLSWQPTLRPALEVYTGPLEVRS